MNFQSHQQPLVSILIMTYNSAKYVIETLESAKEQTYKNIELIVSDDCSTDDTIEVCKKWINENNQYFVRVELVTTLVNKGIPSNCNRAMKASKGEWFKMGAGDDTLVNDCVENFVQFVNQQSEPVNAVFSNYNVYNNIINPNNFKQIADFSESVFNRNGISAKEQFILMLRYPYIGSPSVFFKKSAIVKVGFYDEDLPYDDWPIFLKILKNGFKIHLLKKVTVNYRIHSESIYNSGISNKVLFNNFFLKDRIVYQKCRRLYLTKFERMIEDFEYERKCVFLKLGLNKANRLNRLLNNFFLFFYANSRRFAFFFVKRK